MTTPWEELLVRQQGLITRTQAASFGITPAMVHRRIGGTRPSWQRVQRRVYATFVQPLTTQQNTIAARLYAGSDAVVTGAAALRWRGLSHLPRELSTFPVDVLVPMGRECLSTELTRIQRTARPVVTSTIDHVLCSTVARATADCSRRLRSYETVLAVVSCVLNGRHATLHQLAVELADGPTRGSRQLRAVLAEAGTHVRSVPEAALLRLIRTTGLPEPLVNQPIVVGGQRLVPDIRWGWLILEVDSKEWHLLNPGAWDATQRRRLALEAGGYHVLPITPDQIKDCPEQVIAAILAAYAKHVGV